MNSPYTPWVVLGAIILGMLYLKGYVKLPAGMAPSSSAPQGTLNMVNSAPRHTANPNELVQHGSYALGIAFAKAKRLEAEEQLAGNIAMQAGEAIFAQFTAPFSPPAPAGPSDPSPAGPPPSQ